VDTTMGLTPLDGVAMCTRSGSIDPSILIYLQRKGVDPEAIERLLNRESGLKGLSGLPGDTRIVLPESRKGNQRARLAIDVFIHRLRAGMGQMLTALGDRPDAIVFTGAIGESEPDIRAAACQPFMFLGLLIDQGKNVQSVLDSNIAGPGSTVQVLVIKSQENWQIARESYDCLRASPKKSRGERIDGGIAG
jgi:acetate kinase